ncbi:Peroxisomal membrane protein PMP27 [Sorochytrium milnesiophthora]
MSTPPPPELQKIVKYTATTTGRDKCYRLVQYASKFLAYQLTQHGGAEHKDTVTKLNLLVKHLSLSRKRTPLEYLQTLLQTLSKEQDEVVKTCTIAKNVTLSVWMAFDFAIWAQGVGLWKSKNPTVLSRRNNLFWIYGLLFGWLANLLAVVNASKDDATTTERKKLLANRKTLVRDVLHTAIDMLVPAKGLGWVDLSDGVIGITGSISSILVRHGSSATDENLSFEDFTQKYVAFFNSAEDLFEVQRGLNNCFSYDLVPAPEVCEAAIRACRRVNDFPTAVRVFDGLKQKCPSTAQYQQYLDVLKPIREELGVSTRDELSL